MTLTPEIDAERSALVEQIAEKIRAHVVPSVAAQIPWAEMEMGQDGYRNAAEAVFEMLLTVARGKPESERLPW